MTAGRPDPAPDLARDPAPDLVRVVRRLGEPHPPTAQQRAAVTAPLAPYALVAGAGSGKTQTMALRVAWLVASGQVEPRRVLGLTFTRKAAAQLGERVRRLLRSLLAAHDRDPFLPEPVVTGLRTGEPTVSTYHAYAAALVGEHALRVGVEPGQRLLGEALAWQYASEVVAAYEGPMDAVDRSPVTVVADVLALAGELAEHLRDPAEVRALTAQLRGRLARLPPGPGQRPAHRPPAELRELVGTLAVREALLPLVEGYAELKRRRGALDYGDQVALAARIAREHPEVGAGERARYGVVLLDEYQDTGESQRVLLTELFGSGHPVTAVGDPRQSIYGWRGASAGNLERFPRDFPAGARPAAAGELTCSFRNGERILAVANEVAGGIPVRGLSADGLVPGPDRRGAGEVVCALLDTIDAEAEFVADRIASLRGTRPWGEMAVLARRRAHFPRLAAALRAREVPCEVVGLGGLLAEPEVADVVAVLRVLADPTAGAAVLRLLTGPRWRLGPRDLDVLGRRARQLARPGGPDPSAGTAGPPDGDLDLASPLDLASLLDAVDDPGPLTAYSPAGAERLRRFARELRELRRWAAQPLPDLVAEAVRVLRLDVELAARPGVAAADARRHLDRFAEVAEDFVATGEDPGLPAFLAYLDTAEERERGLEPDLAEPDADAVALLTVHAAKGLEWDVVAVVGLTRGVFPSTGQPVPDWTRQGHVLPFGLRGDGEDLPVLSLSGCADQVAARDAVRGFRDACRERAAVEERRLAYVAVTRARDLLICTGYWWDTAKGPRGPSVFLEEVRAVAEWLTRLPGRPPGPPPGPWAPAPVDGANPVTVAPPPVPWPVDPLGSRRPAVAAAAAWVREASRSAPAGGPGDAGAPAGSTAAGTPASILPVRAQAWAREVDLLLAERAAQGGGGGDEVDLPERLSVSQLVVLRADPGELARQVRRPLPARPRPLARRGTRFHAWLEQCWGQQRLLDVDELPGAADEAGAPDADLAGLQAAFRASPWWGRAPVEVELPFEMDLAGVLVRGRIDAVFADDPAGMVDVVDWKTGDPPGPAEQEAAAVQLAAYRLAWHRLTGTPLDRVRAAFHYVRTGRTVRPVDLLDAAGLAALVGQLPTTAETQG